MYSQQELDDAVAAGVITAEAADALRAHVEGQRSIAHSRRGTVPAHHRLQRHLRLDRRGDPAVRGRLDRPVDRPVDRPRSIDVDDGPSLRSRRCSSPRRPGASRCSSPPSGAWRCPRSCCCWPSSAACSRPPASRLVLGVGPDALNDNTAAGRRRSAPISRRVAAGAAWLHWRASGSRSPSPPAPRRSPAIAVGLLRRGARPECRASEEHHPRLRPAARHRRVPVRHVVGCVRTARA